MQSIVAGDFDGDDAEDLCIGTTGSPARLYIYRGPPAAAGVAAPAVLYPPDGASSAFGHTLARGPHAWRPLG